MILTAYVDESGTHGPSPVSAMAGYVGSPRQWRKFEKRVGKLFRRYRVDIFHAIDVKRGDGCFRGWSVDRKISFMDEFGVINNETLEFGFSAVLRNDDYDKFYAKKVWPKKVVQDTRYGVLFRAIFASMVSGCGNVPVWRESGKLHMVLESGHRNSADALRLYDLCHSKVSSRAQQALAGVAFKTKTECLPLAAADYFAYAVYLIETGGKGLGVAKRPMKVSSTYRGNSYRTAVDRESLEALYRQSLKFHEERQAFGRRATLDGNAA
jgi:Protein of unknown function (DUF3800)